ncbi:hypothetical protein MHPYR_450043 [uncultured Mycobacterium sp.]|uniref:Uncharacterized protein n=1 Tax=uncultured Mycobacterium sp. TaxID=171292 RepID=A0A1Y5PJJ5_9MYCO|nr:hypothetical protein MHPYR_450043 [uncultured Mycobacterium sp.]
MDPLPDGYTSTTVPLPAVQNLNHATSFGQDSPDAVERKRQPCSLDVKTVGQHRTGGVSREWLPSQAP